jgi:hypothetical protein
VRPSRSVGRVLTTVTEHYTQVITSDAGGGYSNTFNVSPAGLLLAARLTGYQALHDQVRIDRVVASLRSLVSTSTSGLMVLYIERDPAAAAAGTVPLALDQFEVSSGNAWRCFSHSWRPQQPTDRVFNLLNPGTVALSRIALVGSGFPNSTPVFELKLTVWCTMRGRP